MDGTTRTDTEFLREGDTCWRIARADRLALITDGEDYFAHLRRTLLAARRSVYLIGWDFDLRIEMDPGRSDAEGRAPDGWPNRLDDFLLAIEEARPELEIRILQWDGALIAGLARQVPEVFRLKTSSDRIRLAFDSHHPVSACHHQKVVVIDDRMAFCGGIDVTDGRWDTCAHISGDERRAGPDGEINMPWHDVTTALEGPAAAALGEFARRRWDIATGETTEPAEGTDSPWPEELEVTLRDVPVGIARTAPRYHGTELVNEIERLYLAAIRGARRRIYIESQYLCAASLNEALEARLAEPDGPEVVVINPRNAESWLEDEAMHSLRSLAIERMRDAAHSPDRFVILHPVNAEGAPIYVHAKVLAADDRLLRIGSSNVDNRSMGFDTECDVAFEGRDAESRGAIEGFVTSLLAEHLDCSADELRDAAEREGSLVRAIEALRREEGRSLRPIEPEPLDAVERALAETRLFDPRYRPPGTPRKRQVVKHAIRRAAGPYHAEAVGLGAVALAVGVVALAAWGARAAARRRQRPEAPMVLTDGRLRGGPPPR